MGTGTRGARGHGWLRKYRAGLGGRHLQGRYHMRDITKLSAINDQMFALNNRNRDSTQSLSSSSSTTTTSSSSKSSSTSSLPSLAFLDLAVEGHTNTQRITIELASTALPQTCQNFINLCNSDYKGTKLFRIEKRVGLCFGDTTTGKNNGTDGRCHDAAVGENHHHDNDDADIKDNKNTSTTIAHTGFFAHEPLVLSHSQKGMVSMLSSGLDKNDSRFLITTEEDSPQLDGKYVAFGRVQDGMKELEDIVAGIFTKRGIPTMDVTIQNCGVL